MEEPGDRHEEPPTPSHITFSTPAQSPVIIPRPEHHLDVSDSWSRSDGFSVGSELPNIYPPLDGTVPVLEDPVVPAQRLTRRPRGRMPPTPVPKRRTPSNTCQSEIMRFSFLPALLLSEQQRGSTPGLWISGNPVAQNTSRQPEIDIFLKSVDVLASVQVAREVLFLAVAFLLRILLLNTFCRTGPVWATWIACLKFALVLLEDEAFEQWIWLKVLKMLHVPAESMLRAEMEILSCNSLSFAVPPREWELMTMRMEFVSASCLQHMERAMTTPGPLLESGSSWDVHKAEICQLYQSNSLEEVAKQMRARHNFSPRYTAHLPGKINSFANTG